MNIKSIAVSLVLLAAFCAREPFAFALLYVHTPGAACNVYDNSTTPVLQRSYGQIYNNDTGGAKSIGCPVQWQESGVNYGTYAFNVYIYNATANATTCHMEGTTSGGSSYISSNSSNSNSGYQTLALTDPLDSGTAHDWAGIEIACSLNNSGSSVMGMYTTLQ